MKTSFTAAFSLVAGFTMFPASFASPLAENLQSRASVPPLPANNEVYHCNTQGDSPGISNIQVGADDMTTWDPTKFCAANSDGSSARMAAGDGYSLFIASVRGQDGNFICNSLAPLFLQIRAACGKNINGDVRAGGSIWVPGYEGRTFVYATADSKH